MTPTTLPPPGVNIAAGNWTAVTDCRYYTADQMQAYATQARADLEAENQRLREALEKYIAWCDAESDGKVDFWERVQMCRDSEAAARAAMEKQP